MPSYPFGVVACLYHSVCLSVLIAMDCDFVDRRVGSVVLMPDVHCICAACYVCCSDLLQLDVIADRVVVVVVDDVDDVVLVVEVYCVEHFYVPLCCCCC